MKTNCWANNIKNLSVSFLLGCVSAVPQILLSSFIVPQNSVFAQSNIVPDNTLGSEASEVIANFGAINELITGGAQREQNLFHSFQEFNVSENRGAYFIVFDPKIQNILARVTGSNRSEILGTLGTRQVIGGNLFRSNANLFLMNPNGIIFGENARLDVNGSFLATTANGVQFGNQGNFSSTNPQTSGVLTVNPSALFFNQINQNAIIENKGPLRVPNGKSLLFAGGDIRLDGGFLGTLGGRVELGGLADAGSIGLEFASQGLQLKFSDVGQRANVSLINNSLIAVAAGGGGDVLINANNLNILTGSNIYAGIIGDFGSANNQAGDVTINASGTVRLESGSSISNDVSPDETGNAGNINIKSASLLVLDDSALISRTSGIGNAGNITINALDRVVFSGDDTTVDSGVRLTGRGKGGDIRISTNTLEMFDGAQLLTPVLGVGDAGNIVIEARDRVSLTGNNAASFSNTAIFSSLGGNDNRQAEGKGGDIRISTNILELSNDAQISSSTFGLGNAGNIIIEARERATFKDDDTAIASRVERTGRGKGGDIRISTNTLELSNDAAINASTLNVGDAGNIVIEAQDKASFDNANIFNSIWGPAIGKGGNISINTRNLSLTNRAVFSTITYGKGGSGNITIEAKDNVSLDKGGSILSQVDEEATGKGGDISVTTNSLFLNVAELNANTSGRGDAGNITINARDTVSADSAIITSAVFKTGTGKGGDISISTGSFTFKDNAFLATATLGNGDAGDVVLNADKTTFLDTGKILSGVEAEAIGQGGDITISTNKLSLTNGGSLSSATDGIGKAGNVIVKVGDSVFLDGIDPDEKNLNSAIFSSVGNNGVGKGGDIHISTGTLSMTNGAQLLALTTGQGNAGNVHIRASDAVNISGSTASTGRPSAILTFTESDKSGGNIIVNTSAFRVSEGAVLDSRTTAAGRGGNITINTNSLEALNGGQLQASTDANGQAGQITINANDGVIISGSDPTFSERAALIPGINFRYNPNSGLFANTTSTASARGGNIQVNARQLNVSNSAQISVNSQGRGVAGDININAKKIELTDNAKIIAETTSQDGGNIFIDNANLLLLRRESLVSATAGEQGNGGNVNINSKFIIAIPKENSDIKANAFEGNGGRVQINTQGIFGTEFRPQETNESDITASSRFGVSGIVNINSPDDSTIRNNLNELPEDAINTNALIANSCIARRNQQNGSFFVTGSGSLPARPNDAPLPSYSTGDVQPVPAQESTKLPTQKRRWQIGDPVLEPSGVYELPNGKLTLGKEC